MLAFTAWTSSLPKSHVAKAAWQASRWVKSLDNVSADPCYLQLSAATTTKKQEQHQHQHQHISFPIPTHQFQSEPVGHRVSYLVCCRPGFPTWMEEIFLSPTAWSSARARIWYLGLDGRQQTQQSSVGGEKSRLSSRKPVVSCLVYKYDPLTSLYQIRKIKLA